MIKTIWKWIRIIKFAFWDIVHLLVVPFVCISYILFSFYPFGTYEGIYVCFLVWELTGLQIYKYKEPAAFDEEEAYVREIKHKKRWQPD